MRQLLMTATICITLILGGCAGQSSSFMPTENVAEFSTQGSYDGGAIPQDVLKRAAHTTLRRGYTHFTLETVDNSKKRSGITPTIGIDYGRDPNAFSVRGTGVGLGSMGSNGGFGIGAGVITASSPRTRWKIVMYKTNSETINAQQGQRFYNAAAITR